MNRKIKFKAWVMKEKEMTEVLFFETREDGKLYVLYKDNTKCTLGKFAVELLQFTGLIDKNGKEIYEGDIIRLKHHIDKRINVTGKVVFLSEQASFGIIDDLCQEYPLFRNTTEQIEIIGNIYENSELLEGKQWKIR